MVKRSLYAVLAGINSYPPPVQSLRGCISDVEAWEEYLKKEKDDFDVHIKSLKNESATKDGLTSAIRDNLAKAKAGDVFFLFYSGHGTRETADTVFGEVEQDKALECLVCYDSVKANQGNYDFDLLSDKELHYLLSNYGKEGTHILTVFDCCHSGGITRNMPLGEGEETTLERRYVPEERLSFVAPMRPWEKFIFANQVSKEIVAKNGWMSAVPQKAHLTLSACQNDESAFELNGHGVFSVNLLDVLRRTGGALSYYDLQARVRVFTQNQFRQTPEIYAIRRHEDDLLKTFLDKSVEKKALGCILFRHKSAGWVIDLGAIHGVSKYSGPIQIAVNEKKIAAKIGEVLSTMTSVDVPKDMLAQLDPAQAYPARLESYLSANTVFCIETTKKSDEINQLMHDVERFVADDGSPFTLTSKRANAGYVVRAKDGYVLICENDDSLRPVTEIQSNDPELSKKAIQFMRHIAQWEYLRTLCNPEYKETTYPVTIKVYRIAQDGTRREVTLTGDTYEFDYDLDAEKRAWGKLKVEITNSGGAKYYCALLYFSNQFQVYGNMLDGKVIGLSPSESAWIYNGDVIDLDLEPHIVDFNYSHSIFYLKLLANTSPFQVDAMEQSALPAPSKHTKRSAEDLSRGLKTREEKPVPPVQWFTRTLCFKGRNPYYVDPSKVKPG